MELVIKHFDSLSLTELYEILKLRSKVFVVEQTCAYNDIDDKDQNAYHMYLKDEEGIQAYLRVLDKGVTFSCPSLGRVLTIKRRCGLATKLLEEGIEVAREKFHAKEIKIEAQIYARKLYEGVGFVQTSAEFMEDGIPHMEMTLSLE